MYVKINPTGCKIRRNRIKVRADFYLDPTDSRYDEHYVQVPKDENDYKDWVKNLPTDINGRPIVPDPSDWFGGYPGLRIWVNNPFLCHFFYIDDYDTQADIVDKATVYMEEAYDQWKEGKEAKHIILKTSAKNSPSMNPSRLTFLQNKLNQIKLEAH